MKNLILIAIVATFGYTIYDVNNAMTAKIDAARPAYSHSASMYESEADECADLNVMHCSKEMLQVLRTQN